MDKREFFDEKAGGWDETMCSEKSRRIEGIVERAGLERGARVLDVGCGTGVLLPFLRKAVGEHGTIVALDFSLRMLREAKRKFGDAFGYVHACAERMPFGDDCFHTVMCFAVFPHFDDKRTALGEAFRVLRGGGRVVIAHADSREGINSFHGRVGMVVEKDLLPAAGETLRLLAGAGFAAGHIEEGRDSYFASAIKPEKT